jgi:hypothetical protein
MHIAKSLVLAVTGSLILTFAAAAHAQITINIPKFPKIKKEKPQTNTPSPSNSGDAGSDANASYDKETFQEIYRDTGYDEFGGYSLYVSPYLDCYGKKHGIPQEKVDMWAKTHGNNDDEALARGQQRLAELEAKLKARMRSFPHTGEYAGENPGLVYEIASKRTEYLQCLRDGRKAEADAAESARADNMSSIFFDELAAARKEVAEYSPSAKIWLVNTRNSEYLDYAVSKGSRKEFYDKWKFPAATVAKFDSQFDALAAEAAPKISAYTTSQIAKFNLRNPVEEKMMRSVMSDVPGLVVHKIGFYQQTWNIEKGDFGLPIRRYKTGAIYGRNPNSDHPYCWIWTINIRQDYAGGGTYGSSYAKYMDRDIAACPGK